jgi:hypothetical protein
MTRTAASACAAWMVMISFRTVHSPIPPISQVDSDITHVSEPEREEARMSRRFTQKSAIAGLNLTAQKHVITFSHAQLHRRRTPESMPSASPAASSASMTAKAKKKALPPNRGKSEVEDNEAQESGGEDGEDDEGEYEIEAILEAENGHFEEVCPSSRRWLVKRVAY